MGGLVVMDALNRAGLVLFKQTNTALFEGLQLAKLGETWSAPVVISSISDFNPTSFNDLSGFAEVTERAGGQYFVTDNAGHASLLGYDFRNNAVGVVSTQLGSDVWSQPAPIPGSSGYNGYGFLIDVSPNGYGAVTWTEGNRPNLKFAPRPAPAQRVPGRCRPRSRPQPTPTART